MRDNFTQTEFSGKLQLLEKSTKFTKKTCFLTKPRISWQIFFSLRSQGHIWSVKLTCTAVFLIPKKFLSASIKLLFFCRAYVWKYDKVYPKNHQLTIENKPTETVLHFYYVFDNWSIGRVYWSSLSSCLILFG